MLDDKTHFIGVLAPEEVTSLIEEGRRWMRGQYGCRSGHSTPVHITIIPPFKANEGVRTRDIVMAAEKALGKLDLPFIARTDGFGSFSDRTIFGNVAGDRNWTKLRDEVRRSLVDEGIAVLRNEKGPLKPHLTVANRDIPPGALGRALEHFSQIDFSFEFPVASLVVFVRDGYRWVPGALVSKS